MGLDEWIDLRRSLLVQESVSIGVHPWLRAFPFRFPRSPRSLLFKNPRLSRRRSSRAEFARDFFQPVVAGAGVGAERFQGAFAVVIQQRAMEAKRAGVGGVDERGGVAGAHLEQDAHREFT